MVAYFIEFVLKQLLQLWLLQNLNNRSDIGEYTWFYFSKLLYKEKAFNKMIFALINDNIYYFLSKK